MKLFTIILLLSLFFGIYGLRRNKLTGIDVLGTLTSKNISCDFHNFVKSTNDSEDDYNTLIRDLTKYCSTSKSAIFYRLLCRMILIELEIGCLLPNDSRPLPIKYSIRYTSEQICSKNTISMTNMWIWQKLTSDEKEELGPTSVHLCPILTSSNFTIQLARFFYKIAPRIRRADSFLENKNPVLDKIQFVGEDSSEKINNTNNTLFEQQDKLSNNTIDKTSELFNQTTNKSEIDSKMMNDLEIKLNKDGLPLGRAGEKPEHEQNNERPKPKEFEVESVFKAKNEEQNWVEGKHNDQADNRLNIDFDRIPGMKLENNPFILSQVGRRKSSSKLKLKKHTHISDYDDLSNNLTTIFLTFILFIIIIYLILRNKNKVLGLIIEGCKRRHAKHRHRNQL